MVFKIPCVHSWKNQKNVFGKRFRQCLNKPCVPVVTPGELAEGVEGSSPVFEVPRGLPRTPLRSSSAEFVCWSCYCVSLHLDLPSQGLESLLILVLNVRRGLAAFCDASCFRRTARTSAVVAWCLGNEALPWVGNLDVQRPRVGYSVVLPFKNLIWL